MIDELLQRELNETEVGQLQVGDKVMVNDIKTEIVEIDEGFSGGTIGFFTEAPIYKRGYGEDSYFWGKHTSGHYKVYKLTGETTMKTKQFTKADLKTGYRIILEDGEVGIVFMDSDITNLSYSRNWVKYINHSNGFDDLAYWNDDLSPEEDFGVSKVVKVVKPSCASDIFKLDCAVKIIWEREAPKTKEQIAYDEAVEATEAARQAYELAQKKLEALNPSNKA